MNEVTKFCQQIVIVTLILSLNQYVYSTTNSKNSLIKWINCLNHYSINKKIVEVNWDQMKNVRSRKHRTIWLDVLLERMYGWGFEGTE